MRKQIIYLTMAIILAYPAVAATTVWNASNGFGMARTENTVSQGIAYRHIFFGSGLKENASYIALNVTGGVSPNGWDTGLLSICESTDGMSDDCVVGTLKPVYWGGSRISGISYWSTGKLSDALPFTLLTTKNYSVTVASNGAISTTWSQWAGVGKEYFWVGASHVDDETWSGTYNAPRMAVMYEIISYGNEISLNTTNAYNQQPGESFDVVLQPSYFSLNSSCSLYSNTSVYRCNPITPAGATYYNQSIPNSSLYFTINCTGTVIGTCGNVFDDVILSNITDSGVDWGYINLTVSNIGVQNLTVQLNLKPETGSYLVLNVSLSSDCLSTPQNKVSVRIGTLNTPGTRQYYIGCYNGTEFVQIGGGATTFSEGTLYLNEVKVWVTKMNYNGNRTFRCSVVGSSQQSPIMYGQCIDTSNTTYSSANYSTYIDNIIPTASTTGLYGGNGSYHHKNSNLTGMFTWTDSNLHRLNITIDGKNIYNTSGLNLTTYTFNFSLNMTNLEPGNHQIRIVMSDAHTATKLSENYYVDKPFINDYLYFSGKTNSIKIEPIEGDRFTNGFDYEKLTDRYTFTYRPKHAKGSYKFRVSTLENMEIVNYPNTPYKTWIVSGDNWIDFYNPSEPYAIVSFHLEESRKSAIVTISGLKNPLKQEYQSFGELNTNVLIYNFSTYDVIISYPLTGVEGEIVANTLQLNFNGTINSSTANLIFDDTPRTLSSTNVSYYTYYNASYILPAVSLNVNKTGMWNLTVGYDNLTFNFSTRVLNIGIDNCSAQNDSYARALTFVGKDEETGENTSFSLNVNFRLWIEDEHNYTDLSYEFRGYENYSVCLYPNSTSFSTYSIMEYVAVGYSNRKYYLYNYILNASHQYVNLYLLNTTKTSEVVETVIESTTTDPLKDVYIRHQRYYPGQNEYKTVEISKTDENGKTLAKLTLADTFYTYILEYPAGTVRLNTEPQKVLSLSKTFSISITSDALATYRDIQNVASSVTCTEETSTCRVSWVDPRAVTQTVRLSVYLDNGYTQTLIYNATSSSSAGTLLYTIPIVQNNTRYFAEAYLLATDGITYSLGREEIYVEENPFASDPSSRLGWLIPLTMLIICAAASLIDIGAAGLVIGSLIVLVIGISSRLLPFSVMWITTFIVLGVILVFKLKGSETQ